MAELKRLRDDNNGLKKLVADQALDIPMLEDINSRKWYPGRRSGQRLRKRFRIIRFRNCGLVGL